MPLREMPLAVVRRQGAGACLPWTAGRRRLPALDGRKTMPACLARPGAGALVPGAADPAHARPQLCSGRYAEAWELTQAALERDPLATQCLPAHCAAGVALRRKEDLFLFAHRRDFLGF